MPAITILSYDEASRALQKPSALSVTHVVSINNPGTRPPAPLQDHDGEHLVLHVWDDVTGDDVPGRDTVQAIIDFASSMTDDSKIICHCAAGISRSSAAALTILASKVEPSAVSAMRVIQDVLDVRPQAFPNRLMVRWADELLGFEGALIGVYAAKFQSGPLLDWIAKLDRFE